ncbi:MAG: reverse transcriptase domain-containing protein [Stellaceae bacterium]
MEDGSVVPRTAGTPQGGVISPLLANLFLHYAFDAWMSQNYPHIPFERYADDAIRHCKSAEQARALWSALQDRFAACKLVLHLEKTNRLLLETGLTGYAEQIQRSSPTGGSAMETAEHREPYEARGSPRDQVVHPGQE